MNVYRIKGIGLYSQIHCVVARNISEASQAWKEKYKSEPEGIELYSEYVIIFNDK